MANKAIWRGLKAGLGVEDIAVEHSIDVETVRDRVRQLRADGGLRVIYGGRGK